jgi:hypothetical protein
VSRVTESVAIGSEMGRRAVLLIQPFSLGPGRDIEIDRSNGLMVRQNMVGKLGNELVIFASGLPSFRAA